MHQQPAVEQEKELIPYIHPSEKTTRTSFLCLRFSPSFKSARRVGSLSIMHLPIVLSLLCISVGVTSFPHSLPRDTAPLSPTEQHDLDGNLHPRGCFPSKQECSEEPIVLSSRPGPPPAEPQSLGATGATPSSFLFNRPYQEQPGLSPSTKANGQPLDPVFVPNSPEAPLTRLGPSSGSSEVMPSYPSPLTL